MPESHSTGRSAPAGSASLPRTPPRDRYGRDTSLQVAAVVVMGRTVVNCRHGYDTWCSCKVRDLAGRMIVAGWVPPADAA